MKDRLWVLRLGEVALVLQTQSRKRHRVVVFSRGRAGWGGRRSTRWAAMRLWLAWAKKLGLMTDENVFQQLRATGLRLDWERFERELERGEVQWKTEKRSTATAEPHSAKRQERRARQQGRARRMAAAGLGLSRPPWQSYRGGQ